MSENPPLLEIDNVVSGYGDLEILHGVSLSVMRGEIVALIGSNGAGKTTLLKTVAGLLRVRSGNTRMAGVSLRGLSAEKTVKKGLSLVPEGRHVFADLSVEDNLFLGAYGLSRQVRDERAAEMYGRFPILGERRKQDAGSLSGGEQQMLALSRALMRAPSVLLLDEPSMGLAPIIVERVFSAIGSLRETGVSVLLVEQNVAAALEIADRAHVIESGKIVREGAARELLVDPSLSGSFLGSAEGEPSSPAGTSLPPQNLSMRAGSSQ